MVLEFPHPPVSESERTTGRPRKHVLSSLLGKGAFASVFAIKLASESGQFAAKVFEDFSHASRSTRHKVEREIAIHSSLDHPRIVRFHRAFRAEGRTFAIMELCHNRSLRHLLRRRKQLTSWEVAYFMLQTLQGVSFLHSQGVVHRDIKPANVLIASDMTVRVADFGFAVKLKSSSERRNTFCGTLDYISPEVIAEETSRRGCRFEADMWALGCMMFELFVGRAPFEAEAHSDTTRRIRSGRFSFPRDVSIPARAKDLVRDFSERSDFGTRPPTFTRAHAFADHVPPPQ